MGQAENNMSFEVGRQYDKDDRFKAAARLHQSRFRANVLQVDYDEYGNRLNEDDAKSLLNYYDGLNVREELRRRYPNFSKIRDADMLRSEHISFNMFAPLVDNPELTSHFLKSAFEIACLPPFDVRFEWAPAPKEDYLCDGTAFDVYIKAYNKAGQAIGIGIEIKNTEHGYKIGKTEANRVNDKTSAYWTITRQSGVFEDSESELLYTDDMRQIWRNHLLGLAMMQRKEISEFVSIILYPVGNDHFNEAIPNYRQLLNNEGKAGLRGCTFERFVHAIPDEENFQDWKAYLTARYLVAELPHDYLQQK